MTSSTKAAYWEKRDNVAWLYLNSPETRNALGYKVVTDAVECLDEIKEDNDVHVVCLTGAGGVAFCAGLNLRELSRMVTDLPPLQPERLHNGVRYLPQPVIAVVRGYCLGGGISLLANCDMAVAGSGAQFGLPEAARGFVPGRAIGEITQTMPQKYVRDLIISGRNWDAEMAMRAGLVSRVAPDAELEDYAQKWATDIAGFDPATIAFCKKVAREVADVLPHDDRIAANTDGNRRVREENPDYQGLQGESRESIRAFFRHEAGTQARTLE